MGHKLTAKEKRFYEVQDGWQNVMSGLGGKSDKTAHNQVAFKALLPMEQLTSIWFNEGMGKKIVTVVADDMTRAGFTIKGDEDRKLADALLDLGINKILNVAMYWARLYAGSIIVGDFAGDTEDLDEALPDGHGELVGLRLFDKTQVRIETDKLYDAESPKMGQPEVFVISPAEGSQFDVHESRTAWFSNDPIPQNTMTSADINDRFWGSSSLQAIMDDIAALGTTQQALAQVMQEMVIGKLKLGNLGEILAENNAKALYDRMEVINVQKGVINMLLLGQDEEFSRDGVSLQNVPEAIEKMYMRVQAVSNIPKTKLTGEQQSGLSNTDNSSLQNYYTDVESKQNRDMYTPISRIVSWVNASMGVLPITETPVIEFNPVWEPPAAEKVKLMLDWATSMEKFIAMGVLTPVEVRNSTFGTGRTTFTITLDDTAKLELPTIVKEPKKES